MTHAQSTAKDNSPVQNLVKGIPTLLVMATIAVGWMFMHHLNSGSAEIEDAESTEVETAESDVLKLPEGKLAAGHFKSEPVELHKIQHQHTVPGRLRYDETKHIDVKTPIDGILSELLVTPGQHVQQGQLIAVLRSPEIGQARAEILKSVKQKQIARSVLDRELQLTANLNRLFELLQRGDNTQQIEAAFRDQTLGPHRQEILSAYANMRLADDLIEKVRPLAESGSVPGRVLRERENEKQLAETAFQTARDQAAFKAEQAKLKAEADVAEADRQLNLAWQSLETLLGYQENRDTENLTSQESLSRLEVRAPMSGTVESRGFATDERVMRGDSIIVLANTTSLTVEANIRESDWSAVNLQPGTEVLVSVPAIENKTFAAKVRYFGREVLADTNSVPLVAALDNRQGVLRPGMFVRVTVPLGTPNESLAVHPESIVQHENQEFVFIEVDHGTFKRCNIISGQRTDQWVEVLKGVEAGQKVVTEGTFLLKSELLLQGEGE